MKIWRTSIKNKISEEEPNYYRKTDKNGILETSLLVTDKTKSQKEKPTSIYKVFEQGYR